MALKIALPKGRLLRKTAALLQKAQWGLDEYHAEMGFYRPKSARFPDVLFRVFHEKDIPIQIAMGNYDLGICCQDWIEELVAKYPSSDLVQVRDLAYGAGRLYMASAGPVSINGSNVRIASEYPNLAEAYALKQRLGRFSVFPVWGAAEAYPPENADVALLAAESAAALAKAGMTPVSRVLDFGACLIANRQSWQTGNLGAVVASLNDVLDEKPAASRPDDVGAFAVPAVKIVDRDMVRLALPDGHQQGQTVKLLDKAGITLDGYPSDSGNRRPGIDIPGVFVKVIRPQDMPLQVANGNFDIAITGRDWLTDHLDQFPSSPVAELLDLKLRKVRLVAVVHGDLPVANAEDLRRYTAERAEPFRVASEYVNIADKYARDNHLGHYRVIPTWGATEAFLPDDADMLIENTETGRTIARHGLKIIETIFESTACLVGNQASIADAAKQERLRLITGKLAAAVETV